MALVHDPGPGEPGHETWEADSWIHGGSPTWLTGSYDAELNTLYWAIGNPGPDINGDVRKGDNLYSCSVVALDPDTGKLKWHYQFTPNDTHDWDSTEDMVLVDRMWHGAHRKLLLHGDRNGVFYVLDRTNGKFLQATPFVRATSGEGLGRERAADHDRELARQSRRNHGISGAGRRVELPGAVVQFPDRLDVPGLHRCARALFDRAGAV